MNYTLKSLTLLTAALLWCNGSFAQVAAGHKLQKQGQYEAAFAAYNKDLGAPDQEAEALYGLATVFNQEGFSGYNPDSAWHCLSKAQIKKRKLSSSKQQKLRKKGFDETFVRTMKTELREKAVRFAVAKSDPVVLDQVMETYKPLSNKQRQTILTARNVLALGQIENEYGYDSLLNFLSKYNESIQQYTPELVPRISQSAWRLYFIKHDSTNVRDILGLLREFPVLSVRADVPLSKALLATPFVLETEAALNEVKLNAMPQTARIIYFHYWLAGEEEDLKSFESRYVSYARAFGVEKEIELAKKMPSASFVYNEGLRPEYEAFIKEAAPRQSAIKALQHIIEPDVNSRKWQAAIEKVESVRSAFPEDDKRILKMLEVLRQKEQGIKSKTIEGEVNSPAGEYVPVISANGQYLYFCRQEKDGENIYFARNEGGKWVDAKPAGKWNTPYVNEAPLDLSADGSTLILFKEGKVMYSQKERFGWSEEELFFQKDRISEWQGAVSVAANREAAIFEARRKDRFGIKKDANIDLFLSLQQPDGSWGPGINLGAVINTPFNDRSPFLHPDMRTLYFSSEGHGSLGGMDVYKTTRIGDGWLEWSEPVNLGKEINTPGDDWGYKITTDGSTAYFAADVKNGKEDIFSVQLPEAARPKAVGTISGKLLGLDGKPLAAQLEIRDLESNEKIGTVTPDPQTGEYYIVVPLGKMYGYVVSGETYFPVSGSVDLRKASNAQAVIEDITVPSVSEMAKESVTVPLKNLFFDHDQYTLKPESSAQLEQLVAFMKSTSYYIEIVGHTDNNGAPEYNLELSQNRANAVREYLVQQGCDGKRIEATGFGISKPLASNTTEAGRAQNRRVEIRIAKAR